MAAVSDDDFARLMLERTGNYIGTAIASVINLLNIETIVVGGPTMLAGNVVLNAIIRSARELSFSPSFESTLILAGELGDRAAASGAALLANDI
jgi:predicted NBD/HSP70 family sugar kinase